MFIGVYMQKYATSISDAQPWHVCKWLKKHGQDTYYGGCSDSGDSDGGKMVCDSGNGVKTEGEGQ